MDLKNLHSHFEKSQYEPSTADDAWKRLYGDKPFSLDHLDFQERLATAKAWRQESIKLAQEESTRQQRELSAAQRHNLILSLCKKSKSQQLEKGERDMHDTINTSNTNFSYQYEHDNKSEVRETSKILEKENRGQDERLQEEQYRDAQRQEEQQHDEQQREQQHNDEQRQEEQHNDEKRQEEQRHDEQRQTEQRHDEQRQEEQRHDEQRQEEQHNDEQHQVDLKQEETQKRQDDDRAYEEAEARYKQLEELDRFRQLENRLGPNSQDSILSRFLDFIEKDNREHDLKDHNAEPEHQQEDFERPSYDDNIPEHGLNWGDIDRDDDYARIDELLNSFDRSLDVEKDIDLSIHDTMLIDQLDKFFDIERDVEMNWNLDNKATEKELNLDQLLSDMQLDENAPFQSEKFDKILYGHERSLALSVHERTETDKRIESWQDYAFDPILIHEQSDRDFSEREMNHEEIESLNSPEHSQIEQQSLDQIMQQQVNQNMQAQIQQTFMSNHNRSEDHVVLGQPIVDKNQELGKEREEDSSEHTR